MHATIFDIDGTLLQSANVDDALYRKAVNSMLGDVRLRPTLHDYDFITDAGILSQIFEDNGIAHDGAVVANIKARFVELLRTHISEHGPFVEVPGARDLLGSLTESRQHAVAIATGGWRESAELKLESAGIEFDRLPLATANDHHERTGIMKIALSRLGSSFESITYYGDGPWDREACTALGWRFVSVGPELGGIRSFTDHHPPIHSLRPMSVTDMDAIFHVRTSVVHNHLDNAQLREIGITRESVAEMLNTNEVAGWCAVADASVVGFSLATAETREVNALFVLPEYAGHGIGHDLLDVAVGHLRSLAPGVVRLRTDPAMPAYNFYLRRGWRDTGKGRPEDGSDGDRFLELE